MKIKTKCQGAEKQNSNTKRHFVLTLERWFLRVFPEEHKLCVSHDAAVVTESSIGKSDCSNESSDFFWTTK